MSTGDNYVGGTSVVSRPIIAPGAAVQSFKTWSSIDREPHVMGASSFDPVSKAIGRFVNMVIGVISVSFIAVGIGVLIAYARHVLNS